MCSMYWTLIADVTCPYCGTAQEMELQTHFMGDVGGCENYYGLGQTVPELKDTTLSNMGESARDENGMVLDDYDELIGTCNACDAWVNFLADIEQGAVMRVWPEPAYASPKYPPTIPFGAGSCDEPGCTKPSAFDVGRARKLFCAEHEAAWRQGLEQE